MSLLARARVLDDPAAIRRAGRELLALALMDARNALLAQLDGAAAADTGCRRLAVSAGAWQEHWISTHVQRGRGEAADATAPRLAGIEPRLAGWLGDGGAPDADTVRAYLAATLETTLELLAGSEETDTALYVYRQALRHEDRLVEALAQRRRESAPPPRPERPALWVPARRFTVGTPRPAEASAGFVPEGERGALEVDIPEFEIDAQPVSWARFAEFADDGGYDRDELWSDAGRAWRDATGRRAPGFVEQVAGGVVVERGLGPAARLERAPRQQPAMHVTRHEAEAWCRWAGRRLPTEPEWELAAATLARQGFAWGEVPEWTLGSARAWPGAGPWPAGALDVPAPGLGVLRGASWALAPRWRVPQARRFVEPGDDTIAAGFRSVAP